MRAVGVLLDEALGGRNGRFRFTLAVIGISHFQQRLLRIAPVGVARLQRFIQLDGRFVVFIVQFFFGLAVYFLDGHLLDRRGTIRQRFEDAASG